MKSVFTFAFLLFASAVFSQSYIGPESVDYDSFSNRYLVSNSSQGTILSYNPSEDLLEVFVSGVGTGPYGLEVVGEELFACSGSQLKAYNLISEEQTVNVNLNTTFANGITHKENDVFVTDFSGKDIYRYNTISGNFNMYIENLPKTPNGIFYDDIQDRLLVVCWGNNAPIYEINMADSSYTTVANTTLGNCDGIAMDNNGDFYVSAWSNNAISKFNSDFSGGSTVVVPNMSSPADIYYNRTTDTLAIPNSGNNTVVFVGFGTPVNSYICVDEGCVELNSEDGDYATLEDCEAICQTTGIEDLERTDYAFYPNPTTSGSIVTLQVASKRIELYNLHGQKVFDKELNNKLSFKLPNLKKGVYLLKTNELARKIIIQ